MPDDNMKLWNSVCETDPAITKKVITKSGKPVFTAICAQAQLKKATELWGPYGSTWGVKEIMVYDRETGDGDAIEVTMGGTFYYPGGEFEISTDMAFKPGNDTNKKLLTDLTTKALSKLGFNSDVFEGKFDDNKYVDEMNEKFGNTEPKAVRPKPNITKELLNTPQWITWLGGCSDFDAAMKLLRVKWNIPSDESGMAVTAFVREFFETRQ